MAAAGVDKWSWLPKGVQAVLVLHLPLGKDGGLLVVASDRERWGQNGFGSCIVKA